MVAAKPITIQQDSYNLLWGVIRSVMMSVKLVKQPRRKTYQIRVWLPDHKKTIYVNTYETNERDAKKVLKKYTDSDIEYKLGQRESVLPDKPIPTLSEAIDKYLDLLEKDPNHSKSTITLKRFALKEFKAICGASTRVNMFTPDDGDKILEYYDSKKRGAGAFKGKVGFSEATTNMRKRVIRTFLYWCIKKRKWINDELPFDLNITDPINEPKLITPDEFEKLLANEPDQVLQSYYKIGYYCGLRRCEINDSDLIKDGNGENVLWITTTKGRKSPPRDVKISNKIIKDWQIIKAHQYKLGRISKGINRAFKRAGIYRPYETTFHALRHSYATISAANGMNPFELKESMGHKSLNTTERYTKAKREHYILLKNTSVMA